MRRLALVRTYILSSTACQLSNWVTSAWPSLNVDHELVSFGGATHDIGKALHIDELSGPGTRHEVAGRTMLESLVVPPHRARFAVTHNAWLAEGIEIEDLLVATADKIGRVAGRNRSNIYSLHSWLHR
jgi:hypothetical protein